MALKPLTLVDFGGGGVVEDVNDALRQVAASFEGENPIKGKRSITIVLTIDGNPEEVLNTTQTVKLTIPARKRAGVAWQRDGQLKTEELCVESTQTDLTKAIDLAAVRKEKQGGGSGN